MSEYSTKQLAQAYQYLQENSKGETFSVLSDTLEGSPQQLFTSTPEQKADKNINVNNPSTAGTTPISIDSILPIFKSKAILDAGVAVANKAITGTKKVVQTANKIDDEIGRKIGIAKDNIKIPDKIMGINTPKPIKWTKDIGYEDVNDAINPSMPAATAIGGGLNIIYNEGKTFYNKLIQEEEENEKNQNK